MRIALAGNPNCGKTTLFNILTGSRAQVGNWSGVTVERKEGKYKYSGIEMSIIDLPGIYSLSPYTPEEVITRNYIATDNPDLIINIVDATNIERNLYLTSQLLELDIPIVIALNMMDELKAKKVEIDIPLIEKMLGVPVRPIVASKNIGVIELMNCVASALQEKSVLHNSILEGTEIYSSILQIHDAIKNLGYSHSIFNSIKLFEEDPIIMNNFDTKSVPIQTITRIIKKQKENYRDDLEVIVADLRYKQIIKIVTECVKKGALLDKPSITDRIDSIVTNRILALPVFILIMFIVFQISVGPISNFFQDPLETFASETLPSVVTDWLLSMGASDFAIGLVVDGVIAGIGSILSFLPIIILLFLCLSILEDTGYMARAAFIMDRLFRHFGLSGKSFVPLLIGFGCSVPAIMATRTLEDEKSKRMTIILMPFMSCSAKLPVYLIFVSAFFSKNAGTVVFSLYMLGIVVAILSGLLLKRTTFKDEAPPFIMEMPPYRLPTLKTLFMHLWEKAKGYVIRVGTILLAMSVIIWFLQTFSFSMQMVADSSESIFAQIGKLFAPIFIPAGFGNWETSASILTGLVAKEAVVSTLGILYNVADISNEGFSLVLRDHYTPLSAYSLMAFVLLYTPCVAALATMKKELASWKWTGFAIVFQCSVAWLVATLIYQVGSLFT